MGRDERGSASSPPSGAAAPRVFSPEGSLSSLEGFFRSWLALCVLAGLTLSACGPRRSVEAEGAQAERVLEVEVFADLSARQDPRFWERVQDRVARLEAPLQRFSLRLRVTRLHAWEIGEERSLPALYRALSARRARAQSQSGGVLWLGWTQRAARSYPPLTELSYGAYGDPTLVVRGLDSHFIGWRRRAERERRLAIAESNLLLRQLAISLGAIRGCGPRNALLSAAPAHLFGLRRDRRRRLLSPRILPISLDNQRLIQLHLGGDAARPLTLSPERAASVLQSALQSELRRCEAAYGRFSLWGQLAYQRPEALLAAHRAGALEHSSLHALAQIARGLAALSEGSLEEAYERCHRAADQLSLGPAGRCAGIAAAKLHRDEHAIRYLRGWLEGSPRDLEARVELALALGRSGDDESAARQLTGCLLESEGSPFWGRVLLNLGIAEARLGRYEAARALVCGLG